MGTKHARGWLVLLGGVLALAWFTAAAQDSNKVSARLDQLLKMEGIDSSYAVTYRNVDGKAMTRADFLAMFVQKHLTLSIEHDPSKHVAVLSLATRKAEAASDARMQAHMLKPGQPLPAFRLTDLDGRVIDNAALRGHVTLVNFFFATCAPCIQETPALTAYAKAHPQMHVLAVTFDDAKTARDYVATRHFSWPVLVDGMPFTQAMGVNAYPQLALVGADGRLLAIRSSDSIHSGGGTITPQDLDRWVNGVLAKQSVK